MCRYVKIFLFIFLIIVVYINIDKLVFAYQNSTQQITLNLDNVDLNTFIKFMSKVTGKNFVIPERTRGRKITIIAPMPISVQEAYKVLQSALELYGYTTIPSGEVIKIVPVVNARRLYTPVLNGKVCLRDRYVIRLIHIKNVPVENIRRTIANIISKNGLIMAFRPTNLLIITDLESNIKKIIPIIKKMDVPTGEGILRIFKLRYASANYLTRTFMRIFPSIQREESRRGITSPFIVVPYNRLNMIIVLASSSIMEQVERLIKKIDVPSSRGGGDIHVIRLQNALAEDLAKVLSGLAGAEVGNKATGTRKAIISRETRVVADKATNSLIVTASPEEFSTIEGIIKKLDVPRKEVFIEALVMEVSGESSFNWGINWQGIGNIGGGRSSSIMMGAINGAMGSSTGDVVENLLTQSNYSRFTFGILSFPFSYDINHDGVISSNERFYNLGSFIRATRTNNRVDIISHPQLMVLENQEATVVVAENRPFQTKIETTDNQNYASYEYKDVGITLKVIPQINENGMVKMKIYQEVSRVDETMTYSDIYSLRPITKKRSTETTVEVKDGQTIVISGLIEEQNTDNRSGVPFLSKIPILGYLFKTIEKKRFKKNLMVFITPHIIRNEGDVRRISFSRLRDLHKITYGIDGKIGPVQKDYILFSPLPLKLRTKR